MAQSEKNIGCKLFTKKHLLLALLIVYGIAGVYSISVGVWLYREKSGFYELTPSSLSTFSAGELCCAIGLSVCIISPIGTFAVLLSNRRLLLMFILSVLLLAFIQTFAVVIGLCYMNADKHIRSDLLHSINHTPLTAQGLQYDLNESWDRLQKSLECCGVDHEYDWYYSSRWPSYRFVPDSCCDPTHFSSTDSMKNCGKMDNNTMLFKKGCYDVFADWLYHHISILNCTSFFLLIIEIISSTIAILLVRSNSFFTKTVTKSRKRREEHHLPLVEMDVVDESDLKWMEILKNTGPNVVADAI